MSENTAPTPLVSGERKSQEIERGQNEGAGGGGLPDAPGGARRVWRIKGKYKLASQPAVRNESIKKH